MVVIRNLKSARNLVLLCAIAWSALPGTAPADQPVQEFNVQLKDISKEGRYTISVTTREYDLSGAQADPVANAQFRFPSGVTIRKEFLKGRFFCDLEKLKFSKNPDKCRNAQIGTGTAVADVRPIFPDPINANLTLFLGKGGPGQVATLIILGEPISSDQIVRSAKQVLVAPIVNDPTPDGRYGYRMDLDAAIETPIPNLTISIPEVRTTVTGLTLKKKGKKIFWTTPPKCTPSSQVFFQTTFNYKSSPPAVKEVALPCLNIK